MGLDDIVKARKAKEEPIDDGSTPWERGEEVPPPEWDETRADTEAALAVDLVELKALVHEFAQAWWAEKDAKAKKEKAKKKILELYEEDGVDNIDGDDGVIKIVEKSASYGVILDQAKQFLTEDQIEKCTGITKKASVSVTFVPVSKRPKEE